MQTTRSALFKLFKIFIFFIISNHSFASSQEDRDNRLFDLACEYGDAQGIMSIIYQGNGHEMRVTQVQHDSSLYYGMNVLHWAAFHGDQYLLETLIREFELDPNSETKSEAIRLQPIHIAMLEDHNHIRQTLINIYGVRPLTNIELNLKITAESVAFKALEE